MAGFGSAASPRTGDARVPVLAEGRPVNVGCATGHPSFVMSARFTNRVMARIERWDNRNTYENKVCVLPKRPDEKVALRHIEKIGVKLTKLTAPQGEYPGVPDAGPFKPGHYRY